MTFVPLGKPQSFSDFTFIIPAVSIGNVPQLAIDALLCTYQPEKVGFLHDRNIAPVVGHDPLATSPHELKNSIGLSAEMFACFSRKLLILQMRAPVVPGKEGAFCSTLLKWAQEQKISKIILLSSEPAATRSDPLLDIPFTFRVSSAWTERLNLELPPLEKPSRLGHKLEGGGLPLLELSSFAHEGDNSADGAAMAQLVDYVLASHFGGPKTEGWRVPLAWSTVFGAPPDSRLY